jgi:hopanoid-associated phosphorylase
VPIRAVRLTGFKERSPGFITGLAREAARLPKGAAYALSGASPRLAEQGVRKLIADGATLIVSFGLAGGLDASLVPGDLILASGIAAPGGLSLTADTSLSLLLPEARLGVIAGIDAAAASPFAKQALRAATGAQAVDMESHIAARLAHEAGLPFIALRAICDPAGQGLPRSALAACGPDGQERLLPVLLSLLAHPGDLSDLIRLAGQSQKALEALEAALERILLY